MNHSHEKAPFLLTPNEARILDLHRSGLTLRQISKHLGLAGTTSVSFHLVVATEKSRNLLLDDRSPNNHTSLSVARGVVRMEGTR